MTLQALGQLGLGLGQGLGGGVASSGVTDAGFTGGSGRNVINVGAGNIGEIIRAMNEGSVTNGGFGVSRLDRLSLPQPDTGPGSTRAVSASVDALGQRASINLGLVGIVAAGVGAFLFLR